MSAEALPVVVPRNVGGRPALWSDEDKQTILDDLAGGKLLAASCRDRGIPIGTVLAWVERDPTYAALYTRAREHSAHSLVEQGLDILDDKDNQGNDRATSAKNRAAYRQWLASKFAHKVYGDKLEVAGDLTINITTKRYTPENTIDVEPEKPA